MGKKIDGMRGRLCKVRWTCGWKNWVVWIKVKKIIDEKSVDGLIKGWFVEYI